MAGWKFFLNNVEVEEPIGWDAVEFTAVRGDFHGIDQPFSGAITFYAQGAKILKSAWDASFVSAIVNIKIVSDDKVNGVNYEYNGIIDFSTYEEINSCDSDSWQISVAILQDNFRDKFKARYDVEVDIFTDKDLDGNNIGSGRSLTDTIRMHGQSLFLVANGGSLAYTNYEIEKFFGQPWSQQEATAILPIYWDTSDFSGSGIFGSTLDVQGLIWSNTNAIFQDNSNSGQTRGITISWQPFRVAFFFNLFAWQNSMPPIPLPATMNLDFRYQVYSSTNVLIQSAVIASSQIIQLGQSAWWNIAANQININLPPNARILLSVRWGTFGNVQYNVDNNDIKAECQLAFENNYQFKLTETNDALASTCDAISVEKFLRRIIHQLTGSNNKLLSDVFSESGNGKYANNVLTNGLLLRKYVPEQGNTIQMKTSFKSAMESLSAIFGIGWGFELQNDGTYAIRVEPYDFFYDNVVELECNNVAQLKQSSDTDAFYSQLKLGFEDNWKNMSLGGVDAVCTDRNYFIDNKAIKYGSTSTLELKSKIICEGIAIEYSRRLQFFDDNSGSSDRPNDYALFLIWTIRENTTINSTTHPYYAFPGESGVISLTAYRASWASSLLNGTMPRWGDELFRYNLFHTSARVALRHWAILGGSTYGMANPVWRFQVGEYRTRFDSAVVGTLQPGVIENTSDLGSSPLLAEDGNISASIIKDLYKDYLTKPIIFEFEYPQSFCDFIDLANYSPYRKVKVTIGSVEVSGFIMSIKNKPEDNSGGTTLFTIIASNIPDEPPIGERAYSSAYSNAYL